MPGMTRPRRRASVISNTAAKNSPCPNGYICVINIFKDREGSEKDVEALDEMSKSMDLDHFEDKNCHGDLNQKQISKLCQKFSKHELGNSKLPRIIAIMAHGNKDGLFDVNGDNFELYDVVLKWFNSQDNPELSEALKIIIIQTCRGVHSAPFYDSGVTLKNGAFFQNTLMCHSSMEGFKSIRTQEFGSPYIKFLTELVSQYWGNEPIFHLFTRVHNKLSKGFDYGGNKYVPNPEVRMIGGLDIKYLENNLEEICSSIKTDELRKRLKIESIDKKSTKESNKKKSRKSVMHLP